jgi:hypothetical protein
VLFQHAAWRWTVRACAVASVVPLFAARHLPMSDLPEHVATIATLRHYFDPAWRSQEYFALTSPLETQYWLYDLAGALLAVVLGGAERANLVILALAGLGYTYGLRALLRALERDERLAVFGAALFWGRALTVGLLNYVVGVPIALYGVALAVRHARAPTRRRAVGLALVSVVSLYVHVSSFLVFALAAIAATWLLPVPPEGRAWRTIAARARTLPRRLLWAAPTALLGAILAIAKRGAGPSGVYFRPRGEVLASLPTWCFDTWRDRVDDVLGAGLVAIALFVAVRRAKARSWDEAWLGRVAALLFAIALVMYFSFPAQIGAYAFVLDTRLAVFVGLFGVLTLGARPGAWALGAAASLTLASAAHNAWEVRAFEREEVGRFDDLLRRLPRGQRLVLLNLDRHSRRAVADPFHYFGSYYRARYGGLSSFSFTEVPHWPIVYRPEWQPPTGVTWGDPCAFRNAKDGVFFDFVMVHGDRDPFADPPPGPVWEVVGATRAWRLYRKVPGAWVPGDGDHGPCDHQG